jgi:hypothetical protein
MKNMKTIEELQEKLGESFDLDQVEDCRKIIGVLLRANKEKEDYAQKACDDLRMLALMVLNGNPEAKDKAQEAMAGVKKEKKNAEDLILDMMSSMGEASEMTNRKLIQAVTEYVWANLNMASRESSILGEMIHRMKKFSGSNKLN